MNVKLKDLLFHVEKTAIGEKLNLGHISTTEFGIFADVDGKQVLLNTCSKNYELLPNSELFPVVEKLLNEGGIVFKASYKMLDYSRFYADYTIESGALNIGNNPEDRIFPMLKIEHSYNGQLKYKLTFGYFRLVCGNGLVVPVEGTEASNIHIIGKHTKQILASLSQLIEKVKYFVDNQKEFAKNFETLASRWQKNWKQRVEKISEVTGVAKRKNGQKHVIDKIKEEAALLTNGNVNDWLIYNAFNHFIYNAKAENGNEYVTAPNLRVDQDRKVFNTIFSNPGTIKGKKAKG